MLMASRTVPPMGCESALRLLGLGLYLCLCLCLSASPLGLAAAKPLPRNTRPQPQPGTATAAAATADPATAAAATADPATAAAATANTASASGAGGVAREQEVLGMVQQFEQEEQMTRSRGQEGLSQLKLQEALLIRQHPGAKGAGPGIATVVEEASDTADGQRAGPGESTVAEGATVTRDGLTAGTGKTTAPEGATATGDDPKLGTGKFTVAEEAAKTDGRAGGALSLIGAKKGEPELSFNGLTVAGEEAHHCLTGELCSFNIHLSRNATWRAPNNLAVAFSCNFMVTLVGPTLAHASLEEIDALFPGSPGSYLATYRIWDAGSYQAIIEDPCGNFLVEGRNASARVVATWVVVVDGGEDPAQGEVCREGAMARWALAPGSGGDTGLDVSSEKAQELSPYEWKPYPCAPWSSPADAVRELLRQNLSQVVFVGDSHMRGLMLHTLFELTLWIPGPVFKAHFDFRAAFAVPSAPVDAAHSGRGEAVPLWWEKLENDGNATRWGPGINTAGRMKNGSGISYREMVFTFYWVDGIFRNREFGCSTRGRFSQRDTTFPKVFGEAHVAVLGSGTWSALRCSEPLLAYSVHLEEFVATMAQELKSKGCNKMFFFGSMPSGVCSNRDSIATNGLLRFQNIFAERVTKQHGIKFFHSWKVVAPRYGATCSWADRHYTCPGRMLTHGRSKHLITPVGEAISHTFLNFLLSSL